MKPNKIYQDQCPQEARALRDWQELIHEVACKPTHAKELVPAEPDYLGTLNASGTDGCGRV